MAERLTPQQWSDYWRLGTQTSFHGHFQNNYDGSIKAFWERCFSGLPPDAKLLDLATGNGALALLAADFAQERKLSFHITAIDSAQIQPPANPHDIEFISHRVMEDSQLPEQRFDLLMSQFGFEYGQRQQTLQEIRRLLKPGGCFATLMHHRDSAVLAQAKEALAQTKRCEKSPLLDTATQLAQLQQTLHQQGQLNAAQQQQAQQWQQMLQQELEKLQRYAKQQLDPAHVNMFSHSIITLFSRQNARRITPAQRLRALQKLAADNQSYRLRMKDLYAAASSQEDFSKLTTELEQRGFQVNSLAPLEYAGQLFCQSMVAYRR